jgi:hypothetical protein
MEGVKNLFGILSEEIVFKTETETDHFGVSESPRDFCVWVYPDIEGVIAVQQIGPFRMHV